MHAIAQYGGEFREVLKQRRKTVISILNLFCVALTALMTWKLLMVGFGSDTPVVIVMSGSMEPGFHRGDILFLELMSPPFSAGDIPVFSIEGKEIPIVHRSISVHSGSAPNSMSMLTKGDNNNLDDRGLYNRGQNFVQPKNLIGRVRGFIPHFGMITIWVNDYPWLKIVLLALMGFFALIDRET